MRRRRTLVLLIAGIAVGLPLVLACVLAYTSSRTTYIADGMSVGNIDVSNLDTKQARLKVEEAWLKPFDRPVVAHYKSQNFALSKKQTHIRANVQQSVERALERTRSGNPAARVWRRMVHGRIEEDVPVKISFSRGAVDAFVAQTRQKIERPAVDASIQLSKTGVEKRPSTTGISMDAEGLRERVLGTLQNPDADRALQIETRTVQPKVSTSQLAEKYPAAIIVDTKKRRLTLYRNLLPKRTYRVAVGNKEFKTPKGLFNIHEKQVDPPWNVPDSEWAGDLAGTVVPGKDPENPLKARWLGIINGVGIHGTDSVHSLGRAASHGCIRMAVKDVKHLYDQVPSGSPIYIH